MASEAPEGSQNDNRDDTKMNELLADEDESLTTSFDEVYDYDSFDVRGLQENLLRGIYAYRFEKPSPSEPKEIVPLCKGLDVVHQAPTRELALQIEKVIEALSDYLGVKKEPTLETQARLINISTQARQKRFNHEFFRYQLSKRAPLPTRLRKSGFREAIKQPRKELH